MQNSPSIKKVLAQVVTLLFKSDNVETIREALSLLINYFDVDWIYMVEIDRKQEALNYLVEVNSPWVKSGKEMEVQMSYHRIPWLVKTLLDGEDILIPSIDSIPEEAEEERMLYRKKGLSSALFIPMTLQESVSGFVGFDSARRNYEWTQADIEDLHLVASILSIILERKNKQDKAEEERKRTVLEIQKMKEADILKSAFLANMSHEIRTPLNAIVGFSNIISEVKERKELLYYQEIITKNNDLLLQIISDVLDFSKMESDSLTYRFSHVDLKDICMNINFRYADRSPNVRFVFTPNQHQEVILYTDPQRLTQVLTNIISNAFKFTVTGDIVLSYHIIHNKVRISVSDTGIGIDSKYHQSIFERFCKLDEFSQGTGLGLTISKSIIETLGGKIEVDSKPKKGSTFWIILPLPNER